MEEQGILKEGEKLLLIGFGAGLTFGAVEIIYGKADKK